MKGMDPPDRARRALEGDEAVAPHRTGAGEELREAGGDRHRTCTRPATAVGGGEGLVQVEMHDVKAHVAGADDPEDRIEVGTVVIEQSAGGVHRRGDLDDVLLEQAEGVRVGEHDPRDIGTECGAQRREVDEAARV